MKSKHIIMIMFFFQNIKQLSIWVEKRKGIENKSLIYYSLLHYKVSKNFLGLRNQLISDLSQIRHILNG